MVVRDKFCPKLWCMAEIRTSLPDRGLVVFKAMIIILVVHVMNSPLISWDVLIQ